MQYLNDLKYFLIKWLVLLSVCVLALEILFMIPVRTLLLPAAASLAKIEHAGTFRITDIFTVIQAILLGGGGSAMLGILVRSRVLALLLLSFFLFLIPPTAGILLYAGIVTNRVDALQKERDADHAAFDAERNLMLSDFAHDLRTPITTIAGYAGALLDGLVKDPAQQEEYLRAIRTKSIRVSSLINLLFDYVKLGSAGFELHKESCDLNALTAEITASLYTDIEDAGMSLTAEIPEEPFTVDADRAQAPRIISNLLTNAVRHNPAGTEIAVIIRRIAGSETIAVADTGIELEETDSLFDPFVRGDKARSGDAGSGLGLSISGKIAAMHGWELSVSQPYERYTKAFLLTITK